MKKLLSILLSIAMVTLLLTGCGKTETTAGSGTGGSTPTGEKTDMLLWLPPYATGGEALDQEWWTETLAPWAEENNVNLTIEITPWGNYEEKYLTAFSSGQGPDVGYMYLEMYNDFIDMGALEPLDAYFTEEEISNYLYYDLGNVKGAQYTLPFIVGNARILYFNMDILNEAGVTELPTAWQDLVDVCTQVKEANLEGVIPFAQEWADPAIGALNNLFYPYLWQAGGDIFNENGEVALTENDAAVKAAQFLYDLRYTYEILPDESMSMTGNDIRDQFAAGNVAVASMSANVASIFDEAGINWDFVPSLEDETKATWIAADSLIMNAASENKELAASLMKHITSPAIMEKFHSELSAFPPISKGEKYLDNERFKDLYADDTYLHTLPVAPNSFKVMDSLYKNLQLMMLGDLTPEQAIQQTVDYASSMS
ncbi:ABC transporter substrate-binding protein [Allofournierella massiliensis]|uniref:Multiple sugar transport system substrate-binding protein n=1 Tax=Allofournierella massiliensis TaxID=1650663 RepID=A0A4R1R761_9FIRM|nr:sugar ABC transporter substrate-binding protein [Fournierella massiliensis]TCL61445.1 multiple sugar transport system substrate-binding protein [Fournierella massiliensis]